MSADLQTVSPDQLGERAEPSDDLYAVVFTPGSPLQKLLFRKLLAKLIKTDLCKATKALLDADLAHAPDEVALVFSDPTAGQNGWYRKMGASGAGAWSQFEVLTKSARDETFAARDAAIVARDAAITAGNEATAALAPFNAVVANERVAPVSYRLGVLPFGTGYALGLIGSDGSFVPLVDNGGTFAPAKFAAPPGSINAAALASDVNTRLPPAAISLVALPWGTGYAHGLIGSDGSLVPLIDNGGTLAPLKFAAPPLSIERTGLAKTALVAAREANDFRVFVIPDGSNNRQIWTQRLSDGTKFQITSTGDNSAPMMSGDGRFVVFHSSTLGERVALLTGPVNVSYPSVPVATFCMMGDSYVQGVTGGTSPASQLATLLGRTVANYGFGGDETSHVAFRLGAVQCFITVSGNSIPASGGVTVTSVSAAIRASSLNVTIKTPTGDIPGVLTLSGSVFTFTRTTSGSITACPAGTEMIADFADAQRSRGRIINCGINDINNGRSAESIIANIIAMAEDQRTICKHTIIQSMWDARYWTTARQAVAAQVNAALSAYCALRGFIFEDTRGHIFTNALSIMSTNGITPTATDTADLAKGLIPQSLRPAGDDTHVSTVVTAIWAQRLANIITSKGY